MDRELELQLRQIEAFVPASELIGVYLGPASNHPAPRVKTKWLEAGLLVHRPKLTSPVAIFHAS